MADYYHRAHSRGRREARSDIARGAYPYLPALEGMVDSVATMHEVPLGTMEIPLYLVIGTRTRGRQNVFSRSFMPLADAGSEFAGKWEALCESQVAEGIREPIRVYEYLQHFYVLEGNKRVSVGKFLGTPTVHAEVTRLLPHPSRDPSYRLYREFLDFWQVCPLYGINFTREGSYALLARELGHTLTEPWPEDDVRDLHAFAVTFRERFWHRAGQAAPVDLTDGDALLIYLKVFGPAALHECSPARIDEHLGAIWDELALGMGEEDVDFVDVPKTETGAVSRMVSSLVRVHEGTERRRAPLRIAFLYEGDPLVSGWTLAHDDGRTYLEKQLGDQIETVPFYDCDRPERFAAAIDAAVADGDDLIVTTSPRQMELTLTAAITHPALEFLNCSLNLASARVRTLYGRMYEPKFILGALAASAAENHQIGYLASYPVYGSVAEVNAFALGAQLIDPQARIHLRWASVRGRGLGWREDMLAEGARVISGSDYFDPTSSLASFGIWHETGDGPHMLAYPLWGWGRCYELVSRYLMEDLWQRGGSVRRRPTNYWWGMGTGAVDIRLMDDLPRGSHTLATLLKEAIVKGMLSPFGGVIDTRQGSLGHEGSSLSDAQIASMRWLAQNVEGSLPSYDELTDQGKAMVRISGVIDIPPDEAVLRTSLAGVRNHDDPCGPQSDEPRQGGMGA